MEEMKTSLNSWQASIQRLLKKTSADLRIAILGIGNTFRSDDAAGVLIARALLTSRFIRDLETVLVIEAGHAPENGTSQLRRFEPDIILMVDAVEMGEQPGSIRLIEMDEIEGMSASTHSLPLSMLANYLVLELNCQVALLGIQPESTDIGEGVTCKVQRAVSDIVNTLGLNLISRTISA